MEAQQKFLLEVDAGTVLLTYTIYAYSFLEAIGIFELKKQGNETLMGIEKEAEES